MTDQFIIPQANNDYSHSHTGMSLGGRGRGGQGLLIENVNDLFSSFLDCIGIMAIMIDAGGTVRLFNRRAEELTGYTKEESAGKDWFKLMIPDRERENMRARLRICLREGIDQMAYSMPFVTRGGVKRPACWSFTTVRDDHGKRIGTIALGQVPPWPDAPCLVAARTQDGLRESVDSLTHDLINHSQVALGYIELAKERTGDNKELNCMLDQACNAVMSCGNLAYNVQRVTNNPGTAIKTQK